MTRIRLTIADAANHITCGDIDAALVDRSTGCST